MIIKGKIKHIALLVLKLIVFVATLFYLYFKVFKTNEFDGFFKQFSNLSIHSFWLIVSVFFIMFINWALETTKWKVLINKLEKISFIRSFMAVWAGLTINNWIPNRMAEFLGRILFISKENRIGAVSSTLAGNFAQIIVSLTIGAIGFVFWKSTVSIYWQLVAVSLILITSFIFILVYFKIGFAISILEKIKIVKRLSKYLKVIKSYSKNELAVVLILSLLRYSVYLFQYYLMIIAFSIDLPFWTTISGVASIFFLQAILPAITITEIGVRGATIIFIFEAFTTNFNGLLAAAYGLWIINIIIPTFFGSLFIFASKSKNQ